MTREYIGRYMFLCIHVYIDVHEPNCFQTLLTPSYITHTLEKRVNGSDITTGGFELPSSLVKVTMQQHIRDGTYITTSTLI